MNFLTIDDLLEVSIFRCKICCRRLQCPIMQVGMFGNICGVCYERTVFTDVTSSADVERLLSKLQVSCNYKERGCTYDGRYYNTCEHEKGCEFRDKICPFAYMGTCDNVPGYFNEISVHISNCHEENILMGKINRPILVPNPTKTNNDLFYLLSLDDKKFLLRSWRDSKCITYAFYYFKNEIDLKNINISFHMRWENTTFTVTGENVHVQHESAIGSPCNTDNVFRIPIATLKSLNSLKSVEMTINIDEPHVEPFTYVKESGNRSVWVRCRKCSKIDTAINTCLKCRKSACNNCGLNTPCMNHDTQHSWQSNNISGWELVFETLCQKAGWELVFEAPCQNAGCNQILKPNEFDQHKSVCLFTKHACQLQREEQCNWQGSNENLATHMNEAHSKFVNQNMFSVKASKILYFIKGDSIFKQTFSLSAGGDLSVTTDKLYGQVSEDSYKWEIRIMRADIPMIMAVTDLCTLEGRTKTINVKNYVNNGELACYADVKSVDKINESNEKSSE